MQKMSNVQELAQKNTRDRSSPGRGAPGLDVQDRCEAPARQCLLLVATLRERVPRAAFQAAIRKGSGAEGLGLLLY